MRVLIFCLAFFAAGALGNSIDDLVKNAFEYIRKEMKEHEPLELPPIPEQVINDDQANIHLTADFSHVLVSKASDFTVDKIQNDLINFWAKFAVTVPTAHVEGQFTIKGNAMGHDISGSGTFSVDVTGVKVSGQIFNELIDGDKLHVKSMTLDYDVQGLTFKEKGLVVQGMTEEQLEEIFNKQLLNWLQNNKALACEKIAQQATLEANELIKGMTLEEVIDWLRHHIQK